MIIVGDNLKSLIEQYDIVSQGVNAFDENSICLSLDKNIIKIIPSDEEDILTYGSSIPPEWIIEEVLDHHNGIVLEPKSSILACSSEKIKIPLGYFGVLQTKGSLARLFVSLHCSDGQVEPGFEGKITFEICNLSNIKIRLKPDQKVGSLFIFKTSTKNSKPYNGRYKCSEKPTIQIPER